MFKKFYFLYSLFFFLVFLPIFIFLYIFKIFVEERFFRKKEIPTLGFVFGNKDSFILQSRIGGGFDNCLVKVIKNDVSVAVKKLCIFGSFFTFWGNRFTPYVKYRKVKRGNRFNNEIRFNHMLEARNISVPKIFYSDKNKNIIVYDFVEGKGLDKMVERGEIMFEAGKIVSNIHKLGIFINDNSPSNYIYRNGNIFVVDLEAFGYLGDKNWDLALFIFCLKKTNGDVENFIRGYKSTGEFVNYVEINKQIKALESYNIIFRIGYFLRENFA